MSPDWRYREHAESPVRLTGAELRFQPLPLDQGVEAVRGEVETIRASQKQVQYEFALIECSLASIEQTLRDVLGEGAS